MMMKAKTDVKMTLRGAVRGALQAPRTATFGALVSQHPITLEWDYFNHDEAPNTDGELWADMQPGGVDDLPYVWIEHTLAQEARIVQEHNSTIDYLIEVVVAPYDKEDMLIELTESNGSLVDMLIGVLDIQNTRELVEIRKMIEIHGMELLDWVEEYMIDYKSEGYHKPDFKAFVMGIRYFVFYHLMGKYHGKTRVTSDMASRLSSIMVGVTRGEWGATLDKGEASEDEAKAFRDMIRHGITEAGIERLQALDYIIDEPEE